MYQKRNQYKIKTVENSGFTRILALGHSLFLIRGILA